MSEFQLISPMLDNFAMGEAISEHHGVFCCPAMANDSDQKYIVKILSIPASQVQLDALLLTGAYSNTADALDYFKSLAADAAAEFEVLKQLSGFEGFLPYEACQVVPMETDIGCLVYLLGPYRRSLARFFRKEAMTHLKAVNLGLDLCAAMALCRRMGYLYVDLKPENIFISPDGEYRVGDLGFVSLSGLQYASLPDRYRSAYTAPEVQDALSSLNETLDIYAIGLILYQAYNDGRLPEDVDPGEPLLPPAYADYEMAEIILKACAPAPEDRWQTPVEMGQAIVNYMQRNGANDVAIVPQKSSAEEADFAPEEPITAQEEAEVSAIVSMTEETDIYQQLQLEELKSLLEEESENTEAEVPEQEAAPQDPDDPANLSFLEELVNDETAPAESMAEEIAYEELSTDTSDILSQADSLIAHETPEPVVAPAPIEIPMPEPIILPEDSVEEPEAEIEEAPQEEPAAQTEEAETEDAPADALQEEDAEEEEEVLLPRKKVPVGKIIGILAVILVLAGLIMGGYYFLTEYYLQPITAIALTGEEDQLTVEITSEVDERLLTAVCTDTYGNKLTQPVVNGKATFTGLNANTLYYVKLDISGLHKLVGSTSTSYTTPQQTDVIDFSAIAGAEEGTVLLRFTVNGVDTDSWKIVASTEGEEDKVVTASGHTATVPGLTVGKTYTFTLTSDAPLYIIGNDSFQYTVLPLILAENLVIESCENETLTASWAAPQGQSVALWSVRCYNDSGFDQTVEVEEPRVQFTQLDTTKAYNIEVTAQGMTVSQRTFVSENSITITTAGAEAVSSTELSVSWQFTGPAPEGNWLLMYTVDNSPVQEVIRTTETAVTITNFIPGATYQFQLQTEDGVTVFNSSFQATTTQAADFSNYIVSRANMTFRMCKTPDKAGWSYQDVPAEAYTATFAPKEKASFVIQLNKKYNTSQDTITALFVIRDADGIPVLQKTSQDTWINMWYKYYCELDIPALPETPGNYTIAVYFSGAAVYEGAFTIQ